MRKNSKRTPNCTTAKGGSPGRMTRKTVRYYSPGKTCNIEAKRTAMARYLRRHSRTSKSSRPSKNSAASKITNAIRKLSLRRLSARMNAARTKAMSSSPSQGATRGKVYDSIEKGMRAVKNGEIFATANGRYKKVSGKKNVKM